MWGANQSVQSSGHAAASAALAFALACAGTNAGAQNFATVKIWDVPFGTHVSDLPTKHFVDPACGTNGGPRGRPLGTFENFAQCPDEDATGLHEVWFIYDDVIEYVGLAQRAPSIYKATNILDQPVILSYLIDGDGRVMGYRAFTDPRAEAELRLVAYEVGLHFKARFELGSEDCHDLPRREGEKPVEGWFLKQLCQRESDGLRVTVESHHYHKLGQQMLNPFNAQPMVNEFESSSRAEVLWVDALPDEVVARIDAEAAAAARERPPMPAHVEAFLDGETVDCPGCDLSGVDLRRRDLTGANLSDANLEAAVLHRTVLRNADLSGADLSNSNLNRADFTLANLSDARLYNVMMYQVDAGRADFSGADLTFAMAGKARLTLANFEGAILDKIDLGQARLSDANLVNATLNDAYLDQAVLFRADMRGVVAERSILSQTKLREANLQGASLRGSDLYGADLTGANLAGADLSATRLHAAVLLNTNQAGARFEGALMHGDAEEADRP